MSGSTRHPHTTSEKRQASIAKVEGQDVRPSRNVRNLPSFWSDMPKENKRAKTRGKTKADKARSKRRAERTTEE